MLTEQDIRQIEQRGSTVGSVLKDIDLFKNGFPFLEIIAPATSEKGIKILTDEEQVTAEKSFQSYEGDVCKFVPASGAASRMFKDLFEAEKRLNNGARLLPGSQAEQFISNIDKFAFYEDLLTIQDFNPDDNISILRSVLSKNGLDYGAKPKGLIKFHKYNDGSRTSFEEHLIEAALYTKRKNRIAKISVTVSPEHRDAFQSHFDMVKEKYMSRYDAGFDVEFTLQKPHTDTIAVDNNNEPFRTLDGRLLFRPAGHGALIENLNDIESDIVIIKNIDNVVKEELVGETVRWKKILAGKLIEIQSRIFEYIKSLDGEYNEILFADVTDFLEKELCVTIPSLPDPIVSEFLKAKLNRPIRVCGMVRNQGEPGGGPYIVRDADGSTSPQILEGAQIDMSDEKSARIVAGSTYFNPVDIVCSLKNYRGEKFDLHKFVDTETGFISTKSLEGRTLKALELPGLWNGAMSQWNTIFVEVPLITFNPVKTVNDLLRTEHQV